MTAESGGRAAPSVPCAICGRPVAAAFAPFCSQRCADIDLGRWLGERYVLPGPDSDPDEAVSHRSVSALDSDPSLDYTAAPAAGPQPLRRSPR